MRLLALVDSPDHVCCRYRIRAFEPALRRAGWSLTCEALERGAVARSIQLRRAGQFDTVVLQRKLLPAWQLAILRHFARRLIFDFDDAVLFRDSYDPRGPFSAWRERRFARIVQVSDVVVAGNDFLADCALRSGSPPDRVQVIPTCVEPSDYPSPLDRPHPPANTVDLVWIGSSSTLQGLEQRRSLWDTLGAEISGLRLRVICDRFPRFRTIPVVPVTWSRQAEGRELAAGHIGVSWIPDDLWSRGKCGLKVLQYQAASLPVVANPVGAHREMIEPGATGFLPGTVDDWIDAVRTLAADHELRHRMGRLARERIESDFSIRAWSNTFVGSVTGHDRPMPDGSKRLGSGRHGSIPAPLLLKVKPRMFQRSAFAGYLEEHGEND